MRRVGALLVLLLSLTLSSCGDSSGDSAEPSSPATTFADPAPPDIDFADYELPADEAEGDEWAREHLDLYIRSFEHCNSRVADPAAPTYDPNGVVQEREDLAREARGEGPHGPWVAWNGCADGISQTPRPMPELDHLRPEG